MNIRKPTTSGEDRPSPEGYRSTARLLVLSWLAGVLSSVILAELMAPQIIVTVGLFVAMLGTGWVMWRRLEEPPEGWARVRRSGQVIIFVVLGITYAWATRTWNPDTPSGAALVVIVTSGAGVGMFLIPSLQEVARSRNS
jgi:hypothetical protein